MATNFGAFTTTTWATGDHLVGYNTAVSGGERRGTIADLKTLVGTAPVVFTGTVGQKALTITGATQTTSQPLLDLSQTWNAGGVTFTGIKANITNTASAAASLLMDLQVGGVGNFQVKPGSVLAPAGTVSAPGYSFTSAPTSGFYEVSGAIRVAIGGALVWRTVSDGVRLEGAFELNWSGDVRLFRDGANTLAQRNDTNAQTFRIYNTYTDASNYERGFARWSANVFEIGTAAGGTGTARDMAFFTGGARRANWGGAGTFYLKFYNSLAAERIQIDHESNTPTLKFTQSTGSTCLYTPVAISASNALTISSAATGLTLGASGNLVALYGVTPVAQPSSTGETTGFTAGSGTAVNDDSTFTGNVGTKAYRLSDVVKHLKNLGILAQS